MTSSVSGGRILMAVTDAETYIRRKLDLMVIANGGQPISVKSSGELVRDPLHKKNLAKPKREEE